MSQINLMSGGGEPIRSTGGLFGGSIFLSFLILVLSFGAYFGSIFYKGMLEKEISSLKIETEKQQNLISGGKANRVADFADRLTVIDKEIKSTVVSPNEPFSKIERSMIPEMDINSYEYSLENKKADIILSADSFRAIAQYIITLKKEGGFSSVTLDGDAKIVTGGKIEAKLILTL